MRNYILLFTLYIFGCAEPLPTRTIQTADLNSGNYECVSLQTNMGEIILALDKVKAPESVSNFLSYSNSGFYDGIIFHRVIDGFMIQGGGFNSALEKQTTNAPIVNEADNGLLNNRGTIAAARTSDPHSATSQFFINTVDNEFLNHTAKTSSGWGYAVFGQVVKGMEVVDSISKVNTSASGSFTQDVPVDPIVISTSSATSCSSIN